LLNDRRSVAENEEVPKLPLPLHDLKSKQRSKRLAGTRSSEHQQVLARVFISFETSTQKLNQLLLPLPWSDRRDRRLIPDIKTE